MGRLKERFKRLVKRLFMPASSEEKQRISKISAAHATGPGFSPRVLFAGIIIALTLPLGIMSCTQTSEKPTIPRDYQTWEQSIDRVLNQPIPGHGDGLRKIYYNTLAGQYTENPSTGAILFPEGAMFVKETYANENPGPSDQPVMLTAMVKNSSSPYQRGSWVWIMKQVSGGVETILNEEFCFTCHNGANEPFPFPPGNSQGRFQDFVFYIPKPNL